jgi:hypothetical protein
MKRKLVCLGGVKALLAASLWGQVGAPLLGYLPSGGHILPVNGIPASASVAPALDFGSDFLEIAISPRQDFALVSAAGSGAVFLAYPNATTSALTGATAFPDSLILSPSGSAAALWFASQQMLQIVSGLPTAPVVRTVNTSFLTGPSFDSGGDQPSALAVSDDGAWAAGAWPGGIWGFGPNGEVRSLLPGQAALALAFFVGQENLAAATGTAVYSIADVGGSAAVATLYTSGGTAPAGLAVSADNSTVVLAGQAGGVVAINAGTGAAVNVPCGCAPDGVLPMGGSLFRITGLTGAVFRVFDARSGSVFQIPLSSQAQAQLPVTREPGGLSPDSSPVSPLRGGTR